MVWWVNLQTSLGVIVVAKRKILTLAGNTPGTYDIYRLKYLCVRKEMRKNYKNSHLFPDESECAHGSVTSSGMCLR